VVSASTNNGASANFLIGDLLGLKRGHVTRFSAMFTAQR
jgi:hypothetical protein